MAKKAGNQDQTTFAAGDPGRVVDSSGQERTLFLIVEDDQDDFTLLERALKKVDDKTPVSWAQDGLEAMEMLSKLAHRFATICLVIDIQLPYMDGFELVERIQAKRWPNRLHIVFLTGNANPVLRVRALSCGGEALFLKPSRHSDFVEMARNLNQICDAKA